jgi:hypothetical protein
MRKQIIASLLTLTLPLWIVPGFLFVQLMTLYVWVYEDVCGWKL